MAMDIVEQIKHDFWVVAGHCASDDEAMEAMGTVGGYLSILMSGEEGDPELVAYGIREFLDELASDGSAPDGDPNAPHSHRSPRRWAWRRDDSGGRDSLRR